jgi:regulator of sigma E protease
MAVLDTLVAVIPLLGVLIVVHELGHFLVAKACGVRVLKFSVGFGSPIGFGRMRLRWERNGTEYVIGWIPLGGFVRMLGEPMPGDDSGAMAVPEDARPEEFLEARPVWQKLSVVFAGPAMNLLLPIVCFVGILWVGFPWPDAVVGSVEANSPAARAGLEVGDRILRLDGEQVTWWDEVILPIEERVEGGSVALEIERAGEQLILDVPVEHQKTRDRYGAVVDRGWIGVAHGRLAALLGVPEAESPAWSAGLRSGDLVTAVGDEEVEDWEHFVALQAGASAAARRRGESELVWQIERLPTEIEPPPALLEDDARDEASASAPASPSAPPPEPESIAISVPAESDLSVLGIVPATILVGYVAPDRPAAAAGLLAGDLVLAVDGEPIGSFESFVSRVQTSGGRPLAITFSREGRVETTNVSAREETVAGPYDIEGMEDKKYQIGLVAQVSTLAGARGVQQVRNPLHSVPRAVEMTWQMTVEYLEGLGKLFTGEVGTDKLSGPIGIARIARKSLDRGWLDYLWMMMLISINLGILNLLPIPILDGGQAVIYSIEGIKRSPLWMRAREVASSIGFAVLVLLMGRAFWNDLTPFWTRFVSWLSSGAGPQ